MSAALYACSANPGKLREFELAARAFGRSFVIEALPGLEHIAAPDEKGSTFEENAVAKAAYYSNFSSALVFADDSGLEVDALAGAPGVYSARFAGPDATDSANNDLLLEQLARSTERSARFVCVLALAHSGRVFKTFSGMVEGEILREPRGAEGFGYDPLFYYPPFRKSFAEVSAEEKLRVSHRGQAIRKLLTYVSDRRL